MDQNYGYENYNSSQLRSADLPWLIDVNEYTSATSILLVHACDNNHSWDITAVLVLIRNIIAKSLMSFN